MISSDRIPMLNRLVTALRFVGIGFFIGGCIVLGIVLGVWLDGRFDTKPLFILLGLGIGLFAAFYGTYRMLLPTLRQDNNKEDKQ